MELTDSHYIQLIVGLGLGLVLFVVAYAASEKSVVSLIVATLPFQLITSGYGTLNTVFIYMVGLIFLLRGRLTRFPLMWSALLILMVLLLSTSQAHRSTYMDHLFYIITMVANFVIFYIVYNYFIRDKVKPESGINLFLFCGFLVLLFSSIKLVFNFDPGITFGIEELSTLKNLDEQQRFVSVFGAAGINGAFHATQLVIVAMMLVYMRGTTTRLLLIVLFVGNAAFLVATGSRGSFLSGVGGLGLVLLLSIRHIGAGRALALGAVSALLFVGASVVIIKFTEYDVLYERLVATEFKGVTPDTRDFSYAIERIPENMILGHGPRLRLRNEQFRRIPGYKPLGYPHNLYLHILVTTGVLGLVAYLAWFMSLLARYLRPLKYSLGPPIYQAAPRLALAVLLMFLVDELKIEFLRFGLADYQQFMFALWAMLLALSDRAYMHGREALIRSRPKHDEDEQTLAQPQLQS